MVIIWQGIGEGGCPLYFFLYYYTPRDKLQLSYTKRDVTYWLSPTQWTPKLQKTTSEGKTMVSQVLGLKSSPLLFMILVYYFFTIKANISGINIWVIRITTLLISMHLTEPPVQRCLLNRLNKTALGGSLQISLVHDYACSKACAPTLVRKQEYFLF